MYLTEGDETRAVSVDLLEELGHVYIWHTQSRAQQSRELISGDFLILICVEQLHERTEAAKEKILGVCTYITGQIKGLLKMGRRVRNSYQE